MIIADYHVHSSFSSDGKATMEQMLEQAIKLGLKKLCFTDHMDYDYPAVSENNFIFDPDKYMEKLSSLKEAYRDRIEILTGVELGLQPHLTDRLNKLMESYPFDFAIGSTHVVDHIDPYYPEFWEGKTRQEAVAEYFQSIIDNCKAFSGFNVYGHIDYIIRYAPSPNGVKMDYSYKDYADILDEALKAIISYGKGIEVNTAGLKYGLGYPHPKAEVLKRYRELGGELITIGSDAHRTEHLCYDFNVVPELLTSLGFKYYATFVQGKPVFEKL
ncbi:MAG TPA: histidinol-phosphatase HisJ family protein [Mobilitalea sp.]|nr:histidinol-phosphatase HisJ family protein [Mobilitalea sp.]